VRALIPIAVWLITLGNVVYQRVDAQPSFELSCRVFTSDTTEADLVARFGAAQVSRGAVFGFDNGPQDGTVLFAQQPEARAEIVCRDPEARRQPAMIRVREHANRWRTLAGVVVGTDLRSLERTNGRPFRLAGLQIEGGGGGIVLSWVGGRLESPQSEKCRIGVYLQPAYDGTAPDAMRQVVSGREYSSGHPAFQVLNPRVVALALLFERVR
jgi:hypothetical protein